MCWWGLCAGSRCACLGVGGGSGGDVSWSFAGYGSSLAELGREREYEYQIERISRVIVDAAIYL